MENHNALLAHLYTLLTMELNHYVFFESMVRLFRTNNIGEAKTRAIIRAITTGERGGSGIVLRMLRSQEVRSYKPRDSSLFLRDKLRSELLYLCELYEIERDLKITALAVEVDGKRVVIRGVDHQMLVVTLTNGRIVAKLPYSLWKGLHSRLQNHKWFKYFAMLAAIRWEMSDGLSDVEFFSGSFGTLIMQCSSRYDLVDVSVM